MSRTPRTFLRRLTLEGRVEEAPLEVGEDRLQALRRLRAVEPDALQRLDGRALEKVVDRARSASLAGLRGERLSAPERGPRQQLGDRLDRFREPLQLLRRRRAEIGPAGHRQTARRQPQGAVHRLDGGLRHQVEIELVLRAPRASSAARIAETPALRTLVSSAASAPTPTPNGSPRRKLASEVLSAPTAPMAAASTLAESGFTRTVGWVFVGHRVASRVLSLRGAFQRPRIPGPFAGRRRPTRAAGAAGRTP